MRLSVEVLSNTVTFANAEHSARGGRGGPDSVCLAINVFQRGLNEPLSRTNWTVQLVLEEGPYICTSISKEIYSHL